MSRARSLTAMRLLSFDAAPQPPHPAVIDFYQRLSAAEARRKGDPDAGGVPGAGGPAADGAGCQ